MRTMTMRLKTAFALSLSALLIACLGVSPKARFYTLNTVNAPQITAGNAIQYDNVHTSVRIQIMPITIDETVDRPQIVITNSQNQVQILEQQRWAQPLKYEIGRVVGEHLNQRIPNSIVSAYPHQLSDSGLQVNIQVIAFESSMTTPAKIKVNYTLLNTKSKQTVSHTKVYSQPLVSGKQANSVSDIIEAQSQNILQLSQDIVIACNTM